MEALFTAQEASRLAGFEKPWMLNHMEREGIFVRENFEDKRHGRAKKYTFRDVVILRTLNRFLAMGARPARIRDAITALQSLEGLAGDYRSALEFVQRSGARFLVTETRAYFIDCEDDIIDLTSKGQLAFGFMMNVGHALDPVVRVISTYTGKRANNWKVDGVMLNGLCEAEGF